MQSRSHKVTPIPRPSNAREYETRYTDAISKRYRSLISTIKSIPNEELKTYLLLHGVHLRDGMDGKDANISRPKALAIADSIIG